MHFDFETYNKIYHPNPVPIITGGEIQPIRKKKSEPVEKDHEKNDDKSGVAEGSENAETNPEEGEVGSPKDGGVDDGTSGTCETDS